MKIKKDRFSTSSECMFCGTRRPRKNGLVKIHLACLMEFTQTSDSIKIVQDFMKGYRPKNEADYPTIEAFLKSMQDFTERCKKIDAWRGRNL